MVLYILQLYYLCSPLDLLFEFSYWSDKSSSSGNMPVHLPEDALMTAERLECHNSVRGSVADTIPLDNHVVSFIKNERIYKRTDQSNIRNKKNHNADEIDYNNMRGVFQTKW